MPRIQLNISDQHRLWIDTQTSEYFGISDVISLLDDAMGKRVIPLHMVDTVPTIAAGPEVAGEQQRQHRLFGCSSSPKNSQKPQSCLLGMVSGGSPREPLGKPS